MNALNKYRDTLSVPQMAEALGLGRKAAYALIQQKKIGFMKIGCKIVIPKVWITDYLNQELSEADSLSEKGGDAE